MNGISEEILILIREYFPYFWMAIFYIDMRTVIKELTRAVEKLCNENE